MKRPRFACSLLVAPVAQVARVLRSSAGLMVAGGLLATLSGCGAVYPELATPLRPYPAGRELAPPPPADLVYLEVASAKIPNKTRDGREWDAMGGNAPDSFAQIFVDDREVLKTSVASNTLTPTWADQAKANHRIPLRAKVRLELWDSNALNNQPICVERISRIHDNTTAGELTITCDSGARVKLKVEPAHARLGLGFYYEMRTASVGVSRVLPESPAARAGLKKGDTLVVIDGQEVKKLDQQEVQSLINAHAGTGMKMLVRDDAGEREVEVKAGAVYPTADDPVSNR